MERSNFAIHDFTGDAERLEEVLWGGHSPGEAELDDH